MRYYIATTLTNWEAHNRLRDDLGTNWALSAAGAHGLERPELTYDWTTHGSMADHPPEEIRRVALDEIRGVTEADVVAVLLPGGSGTHVELGAALAAGVPVVLYAPQLPEHYPSFYRHPLVTIVKTWEEIAPAMMRFFSVEKPMTFDQYDEAAAVTAIYPRHVHPVAPVYPTLGIVGEAGEIAEKVKKLIRDRLPDQPLLEEERDALLKEAGDVLWYLSSFTRDLGATLQDVARQNVQKLRDRMRRNQLHGSGDSR